MWLSPCSRSSVAILVLHMTHFNGRLNSSTATWRVLMKQRRHSTLCLQGNVWITALAVLQTMHCRKYPSFRNAIRIFTPEDPFCWAREGGSAYTGLSWWHMNIIQSMYAPHHHRRPALLAQSGPVNPEVFPEREVRNTQWCLVSSCLRVVPHYKN